MKRQFIVSQADTVLRFLAAHLAGVSIERIRIQCKRGEVRVNGARIRGNVSVEKGDTVEIFLPEKLASVFVPVVYEDDCIVLADKPPLVESEFCLPELLEAQTGQRLTAAHRLDTNTTGLVLLTKTAAAREALIAAFRDGQVYKTYYARVCGAPPEERARAVAYLSKDAAAAFCRVSAAEKAGCKQIVTEYEVIEEGARTSLLKITLHTGKTHQIRAHLAFLKHPVAGDEKYGDGAFNRKIHATRQLLVAKRLSFRFTGGLSDLNGRAFVSKKSLKII